MKKILVKMLLLGLGALQATAQPTPSAWPAETPGTADPDMIGQAGSSLLPEEKQVWDLVRRGEDLESAMAEATRLLEELPDRGPAAASETRARLLEARGMLRAANSFERSSPLEDYSRALQAWLGTDLGRDEEASD